MSIFEKVHFAPLRSVVKKHDASRIESKRRILAVSELRH